MQAGPHISHHRSSAVKALIEVSSVRPHGGVISYTICVEPSESTEMEQRKLAVCKLDLSGCVRP